MSRQFEIAKQIIEETCPKRKLQLGSIRLFAEIIQCFYSQPGWLLVEITLDTPYYIPFARDMLCHVFPVLDIMLSYQALLDIEQAITHIALI